MDKKSSNSNKRHLGFSDMDRRKFITRTATALASITLAKIAGANNLLNEISNPKKNYSTIVIRKGTNCFQKSIRNRFLEF